MSKVTIYTTAFCPYCTQAKRLLTQKAVDFTEIDVGGKPELREQIYVRSGGRSTVPQIWIGDTHVGGCDDLYDLERRGKLDPLLHA
jgi:glutaredoxin 3